MEERILKSINDHVGVVMASVQATIKDLAKKMDHVEFIIDQLRQGNSNFSPTYQSTDGYGMP
jgi:hypothetical protein